MFVFENSPCQVLWTELWVGRSRPGVGSTAADDTSI